MMELVFVVFGADGYAEVRIADDGTVRVTDGSTRWLALDGISFPGEGALTPDLRRTDVEEFPRTRPAGATDELLFHYTRGDTALNHILAEKQLRLSAYERTNDPRENRDWLFTLACRSRAAPPGEALRISSELTRAMKGLTRVACFCANSPAAARLESSNGPFHARMWAQYGVDHRGVVLVFDRTRLLAAAESSLAPLGRLWVGPVEYVEHDDPRSVAFFLEYDEVVSRPLEKLAEDLVSSRVGWLFFTKHRDWALEEEVRIVLLPREPSDCFVPIAGALVEVILGSEFPAARVGDVRAQAARLGCGVSQVRWRNGFPVRAPLTP